MTKTQLEEKLEQTFPDFHFTLDEDNGGQIIIYTGLRVVDGNDTLVYYDDLEEGE